MAILDTLKLFQVLPLARIKRIIKSEGDVKAVSSEASFAVARAAVSSATPRLSFVSLLTPGSMLIDVMPGKTFPTLQELLLEELARRANIQMQSQHRSTLQYKDVGES